MKSNHQAYRENDILGKSPLDLVLQVYDGAISAFSGARSHYDAGHFDEGYEDLQKAKKFLTHLYTTLDFEQGGEVAQNLGSLYAFVISQTNVIEGSKDPKQIDSNIQILRNLRSGWADLKAHVGESRQRRTEADRPVTESLQVNTSV